jgi:uncharacterized protein YcaQ
MSRPVLPRAAVAAALVRHTGLDRRRPSPVAAAVRALGAVQVDPMQVVAPAHLLTLRLRRGPTFEAEVAAAEAAGRLVEAPLHEWSLLAATDLAAAAPSFRHRRSARAAERLGVAEEARAILARLADGGPVLSRELVARRRVPSAWDPNPASTKATSVALDALVREGRVLVVGRQNGERLYDLPERLFPEWEALLRDEAGSSLAAARHYGRTMGLFRAQDPYLAWHPFDAARRAELLRSLVAAGEWVEVALEGSRRRYVATSAFLAALEAAEPVHGVAFLAPLDNLLWDRARLRDVFGVRYAWEAYTPPARRRVGPYGMPVLVDGRFVGELDARFDPASGLTARFVPAEAPSPALRRRLERALTRFEGDLRRMRAPGPAHRDAALAARRREAVGTPSP